MPNEKLRLMRRVCERIYEKPAAENCHKLERVIEIKGGDYPKLTKSLSFDMVSPRPPMNDGRGHKVPPEPSVTSLEEDKKRVTQMLWRVGFVVILGVLIRKFGRGMYQMATKRIIYVLALIAYAGALWYGGSLGSGWVDPPREDSPRTEEVLPRECVPFSKEE